ncbi:MAG: tellerium resistance protein TerY, partial [Acinetobacter sp. 38-8]
TELAAFQAPDLQVTGTTALGGALTLLADKIEQEVAKTTVDVKGDWKPLIFIMTDGVPTDDWRKGLQRLQQVKTGVIVACAAGHGADTSILKQITEVVVELATADSNTIKAFFKWVSASISTGSQKVDAGQKEVTGLGDLPPPPPEVNIVL